VTGRVLVVDDDATIRSLLQVTFETEGLEVETARNGAEAVTAALAEPPAVIVLDVMMPVMDGWAAAERLRADGRTRDVPVVFLTARTQDADLRRGRELGAVAYVTKPFDVADLAELVHDVVDPETARRAREW
jgi:CheY-like chemotaxis protein